MNKKNTLITLCVLITVYTIIAIFSFKLINYSIKPTVKDKDEYYHSEHAFLKHKQSSKTSFWETVINSGVCRFGKFGIIVLIVWSITLMSLLIYYMKGEEKEEEKGEEKGEEKEEWENNKKKIRILAFTNILFFFVYSILCCLMNWPLFIRCIPYLSIQLGVSIWMLVISK